MPRNYREEKRKKLVFFCNFAGYKETNPSFPNEDMKNFSGLLQARRENNLLFTCCGDEEAVAKGLILRNFFFFFTLQIMLSIF